MHETVQVLQVDRELAQSLPPEQSAAASSAAVARVASVGRGPLDPLAIGPLPAGGFLVLEGCVTREVSILGTTSAVDFFGQGDLLRPAEEQPLISVSSGASWVALEPTRLAVLDAEFVALVRPWPHIIEEMLRRQERRADWLAHVLAISHLSGIETRVLVLFWLFADRWGRRSGEEVVVPIPLTHLNIARLLGAQRPTVTTALARLTQSGVISPRGSGHWALRGKPPAHLREENTSPRT